jgi:hypothetical protein
MAYPVELGMSHPNLPEDAGDSLSAIFTNHWSGPPADTYKGLKIGKIPRTA